MVRKTESPVFSASQVDRYASSIPVSFKLKIPIFKSFPLQLHLFLISLNIILLSLMFQIRDQQTTLMKAGAAGFYTTDDPVEIRLQMYLLDFITRLSTSGLWRLQTPHTPSLNQTTDVPPGLHHSPQYFRSLTSPDATYSPYRLSSSADSLLSQCRTSLLPPSIF